MPSLIDIRRRVRSVKNTQQITKAMKMVSAAKLRKAQEKALAARPYAKVLQQMLANVAQAAAQNDGIAALNAQGSGIDGDIGTRFVDEQQHAQRHADLVNVQAVGQNAAVADLTNRIRQGGHLLQSCGDIAQPGRR